MNVGFEIAEARYRKGHSVVRITKQDNLTRAGFKTDLHHAIERLGGKWVGRYRGYVIPQKRAELAQRFLRRVGRRS